MRELPSASTDPETDRQLLEELFENSLRGDGQALHVLLTVLKTRYGKIIFRKLRRHRGYAHTGTIEDIIQDSMIHFMDRIRSGALAELGESERADVVTYFQKICDRRLEDLRKERKSPLLSRKKEGVNSGIHRDLRVTRNESIPGVDSKTKERLEQVHAEIAKLNSFERLVLSRYLAGTPHAEIAKEIGRTEVAVWKILGRVKEKLAERILPVSKDGRSPRGGTEKRTLVPSAQDLRNAVASLPVETQEAIEFVHLEGGTVEALAKKLGDRGHEKAQARLKRGYETLAIRLDLPFPESFSILKNA